MVLHLWYHVPHWHKHTCSTPDGAVGQPVDRTTRPKSTRLLTHPVLSDPKNGTHELQYYAGVILLEAHIMSHNRWGTKIAALSWDYTTLRQLPFIGRATQSVQWLNAKPRTARYGSRTCPGRMLHLHRTPTARTTRSESQTVRLNDGPVLAFAQHRCRRLTITGHDYRWMGRMAAWAERHMPPLPKARPYSDICVHRVIRQ